MKKIVLHLSKLSIVVILITLIGGCEDKSYIKHTYVANVPKTYMTFEDLRASVKMLPARALDNPGKIYVKSSYIYINERFEGIHVIDNSDPASPVNIGFINIPGNVDIAIKGSILYADSYTDLVAIDISGIGSNVATEMDRIQDIFPYQYYGYDQDFPIAQVDEAKGVVVDWEVKEITEDVESEYYSSWNGGSGVLLWAAAEADVSSSSPSRYTSTGQAGSMARFMIRSSYLYVINSTNVDIIDISDQSNPKDLDKSVNTGRNIETLFVYGDNLFIGSTTGMMVYGLSNPESPEFISVFDHATACDPVVVQGNYAYVTLRAGNACGGFNNQLDVIDISSIADPKWLKSYSLSGPYGLGVADDKLFVCDGDDGLKLFEDATAPTDMTLISHIDDINAYDVIPVGNTLLVIGSDGLYQYDYESYDDLYLMSVIPIQ